MTTINVCPVCEKRNVKQIDRPKALKTQEVLTAGRKMKSQTWRQAFASRPLEYWFECKDCKAIWKV